MSGLKPRPISFERVNVTSRNREVPTTTIMQPDLSETYLCKLFGEDACRHPGNPSRARYYYQRRQFIKKCREEARCKLALYRSLLQERPPNPFRSKTPLPSQRDAYLASVKIARKEKRRKPSKSTIKRSYSRGIRFVKNKVRLLRQERKRMIDENMILEYDALADKDSTYRCALTILDYKFVHDPLNRRRRINDKFKLEWMHTQYPKLENEVETLLLQGGRGTDGDYWYDEVERFHPPKINLVTITKVEPVLSQVPTDKSRRQKQNARRRISLKRRSGEQDQHQHLASLDVDVCW